MYEGIIKKVHTIHSSASQCFIFQKNPQYGLKMKHLPLLKWILTSINKTFQEYDATERKHQNDFFTIHNNLIEHQFPINRIYFLFKGCHFRTRILSNYVISYGCSAMFCDLCTHEPLLTKAIELVTCRKKKILPLVLPVICNILKDLKAYYPNIAPDKDHNQSYAQMTGSNFSCSMGEL